MAGGGAMCWMLDFLFAGEAINSICIVRECEVGIYLFQARMNSF